MKQDSRFHIYATIGFMILCVLMNYIPNYVTVEKPLRKEIQLQLNESKDKLSPETFETYNSAFWNAFNRDIRNLDKKMKDVDRMHLIREARQYLAMLIDAPDRYSDLKEEDVYEQYGLILSRVIGYALSRDELVPSDRTKDRMTFQSERIIEKAQAILEQFNFTEDNSSFKLFFRDFVRNIDQPLTLSFKRLLTDQEIEQLCENWDSTIKKSIQLSSNSTNEFQNARKSYFGKEGPIAKRMINDWANIYRKDYEDYCEQVDLYPFTDIKM